MKRSEFLALMFAPILIPFLPKKPTLDDGKWHNVVDVWEDGKGKRYIDGIYSIDGMTETIWYDKKGMNDGIVSGAVLLNKGGR